MLARVGMLTLKELQDRSVHQWRSDSSRRVIYLARNNPIGPERRMEGHQRDMGDASF